MEMNKCIDKFEESILHTYNRYQIVLDRGDGVYLYDTNGKKYLDFAAGIAVFALGYNNKRYNDALKNQIDKLIHTSNYFYHEPGLEAAKKITKVTGMDKVFFTNSGAEAIEGAIKTARKYAYMNKPGAYEIIAMEHSFHGRTLGALSVTGNKKYREAFEPLIGGVKFAQYNDLESVKALVNEKTCAIIVEPVQGEGGIYPATQEFISGLRELADRENLILIFDEVQCGMGRCTTMFASERYNVKPDVIAVAKALGCGVPVGAFLTTDRAAAMGAGDHGSTYGGNPFTCAAISEVLDIYEDEKIIDNVREVSAYLEARLDELVEKYDCIKERRGIGLMQGIEFNIPVAELINKCMEDGLIIISAGTNVIRMVPPLIISKENVDEMINILEKQM